MDNRQPSTPSRRPGSRRRLPPFAGCAVMGALFASAVVVVAQGPVDTRTAIRAQLEARVQRAPGDAAGWRLLGKLRWQAGDARGAADALQWATQLDPESAAAHFDLVQALAGLGQAEAAAAHLDCVLKLAPQSDYGRQAQARLTELRPDADGSSVQQVGYQIKRFERSSIPQRV